LFSAFTITIISISLTALVVKRQQETEKATLALDFSTLRSLWVRVEVHFDFINIMVQTRSWIGLTALLWFSSAAAAASTIDEDKRDDCHNVMDKCTTDKDIWAECPQSCTLSLELLGSMNESTNPEGFFELEFTTHQGKTFDLEDYQGYVTIFAVVPLMHGMSQYFYDIFDHVQNIYPYTIQTIVMPLKKDNAANDVHIVPNPKSKVTLLEETDMSTHQLEYFFSKNRAIAGSDTMAVATDRVSVFLVSTDGVHMEKVISPTLRKLERRIQVFLRELNKNFDQEKKRHNYKSQNEEM
jgi:hypothetical protein